MRVIISESAFCDLADGYWFYEDQEAGIGDYFETSILGEIEGLATTAGAHHKVQGFHRLICSTFPYAVYYRMDHAGDAAVIRILDCRRDPRWLRRQLKKN